MLMQNLNVGACRVVFQAVVKSEGPKFVTEFARSDWFSQESYQWNITCGEIRQKKIFFFIVLFFWLAVTFF